MNAEDLRVAFYTRDLTTFMEIVFPPLWRPIAARILESGATMSTTPCDWAPRWTPISPTVRTASIEHITHLKSCIYRAHDCLHQLWGLPLPSPDFTDDDFYLYKRAQMCGEVAVLTLVEFELATHLFAQLDDLSKDHLWSRNALPLVDGPLRGKSPEEIATRLDDLLHKQRRPRWVRDSRAAIALVDDYVPMLEEDRQLVDHNWALMKNSHWSPGQLPNARYSPNLDGLELTLWMMEDFAHLLGTDPVVDWPLAMFNRSRRANIKLPAGWNGIARRDAHGNTRP